MTQPAPTERFRATDYTEPDVIIQPNAHGGWSLLVRTYISVHSLGNYATSTDAIRTANRNGWTYHLKESTES